MHLLLKTVILIGLISAVYGANRPVSWLSLNEPTIDSSVTVTNSGEQVKIAILQSENEALRRELNEQKALLQKTLIPEKTMVNDESKKDWKKKLRSYFKPTAGRKR